GLDRLTLEDLSADLARRAARASQLRLLRTLRITRRKQAAEGPRPLEVLFASPHLGQLRMLSLAEMPSCADLAPVAGAPLPRLTHLEIRKVPLQVQGCEVLAGWDLLKRLRVLELKECQISNDGADVLACAGLQHLEKLVLDGNGLTGYGFHVLQQAGVRVLGLGQRRRDQDSD